MRGLLLLILLTSLAADEVLNDQWFTGAIDGQRAILGHEVTTRRDDGSVAARFTMTFKINRQLGDLSSSIVFHQDRRFVEADDGTLRSFAFDDDQNGTRISVTGTLEDGAIVAHIARSGRITEQRLPIPDGVTLYGQQGSQRLLAARAETLTPGETITFESVELMGSRLMLMTSTATFEKRLPSGHLAFSVAIDLMPAMPLRTVLDQDGNLHYLRMEMGPLVITLQPSEGPQAIGEAAIDVLGLVDGTGGPPSAAAVNRYRLPASAQGAIPENGFQHFADGLLVVRNQATPTPLPDQQRFLRAEAQIETDDPDLRAWVEELLAEAPGTLRERAEHLRLAVRAHLTKKDLSQADATALEAFRSRSGDCSEHANLLVAALRIAGIPARAEVGVVYAGGLGGWGGHAWCAAYDGSRWFLLDAAYPGLPRSHYICTAIASDEAGSLGALISGFTSLLGGTIETVRSPE